MTVQDLRDLLEYYDPDDEVRLMMQPNYPFEYSISSTEYVSDPSDRAEDLNAFTPHRVGADVRVVYLCEGSQLGYGTRKAWQD